MLLTSLPGEKRRDMASKSDAELRKEITYLTKLIESHKKNSAFGDSYVKPRPTGGVNRFKWSSKASTADGAAVRNVSGKTCGVLGVPLHTAGATSAGVALTQAHNPASRQPSCPQKYHYSNHHCRGNLADGTHCRSDRANRKWSNLVYTPAPRGVCESVLLKKPVSSISKQTATVSSDGSMPAGRTVTNRAKQTSLAHFNTPSPPSLSSSLSKPVMAKSTLKTRDTSTLVHPKELQGAPSSKWPLNPPSTVMSATPHLATKAVTPSSIPSRTAVAASSKPHCGSARNTSRYRWRRRSTPSSSSKRCLGGRSAAVKSSATAVTALRPTPSWIVHNKYKLTHASIIHKYSRIMQRQRSNGQTRPNYSVGRKPPSQASRKMLKSKNKVWRATDHGTAASTTSDTSTATSSGVSRTPASAREGVATPLRRISGHELKTRQGNRQWVARRTRKTSFSSRTMPAGRLSQRVGLARPLRRLSGHELKTRHGNRQWVARRVTARRSLLLVATNYLKRSSSGGTVYRWKARRRVPSTQLISMSGHKFVVDSGGRRMKRLSVTSMSTTSSSSSYLWRQQRFRGTGRQQRFRGTGGLSVSELHTTATSVKQFLANQAVQRSRVCVWSAKQKRKREAKQYCLFYNRFGRCNRGEACPYIHDPGKIAICTKFLRGMCDKTDGSCLFSHTLSKDKMPTCLYFLRGVCTREVCPYRHVTVSCHAKVCLDFARGHCPRGEQCPKRHVLDCPEFSEKGSCPRGDKCLLRHRKKRKIGPTAAEHVAPPTEAPPTKTPLAFRRLRRCQRRSESEPESVNRNSEIRLSLGGGDGLDNDHQLSPLDPKNPAPDFLSL